MTAITQPSFFAKGKKELPHKIGVSLKVGQGASWSKDVSCSFGSVFFLVLFRGSCVTRRG